MALSQSFSLEFNDNDNTGVVTALTDYLTDYGMNLATLGAKIIGSLLGPDGTAVITWTPAAPCINLGGGATQSAPIDLPTVENAGVDSIAPGEYTLNLQLYLNPANINVGVTGAPDNRYYANNNWLYQFLEAGDAFTVSGAANPGNNGARVVVSTEYSDPQSRIYVADTLTTESIGGPGIAFTIAHDAWSQAYTWNPCVQVVPVLNTQYSCRSGLYGYITSSDETVYGDQQLVSSSLRFMHPQWTKIPYNTSDVVFNGTDAPVTGTVSELYEGPWQIQLSGTVTYTQNDGLIVTYSFTKIVTETVICSSSLCGIQKCVLELLAKTQQDLSSGGTSANLASLINILTWLNMAWVSQDCSDWVKYKEMVDLINEAIGSLGCSCGCDESTYKKIQNLPSDEITYLETLNSLIQWRLYDGGGNPPTVNDDASAGVQIYAVWTDKQSGISYRCTDPTTGAAVWEVYTVSGPNLQQVIDAGNEAKVSDSFGAKYAIFQNEAGQQIGTIQNNNGEEAVFTSGNSGINTPQTTYKSASEDTNSADNGSSIQVFHPTQAGENKTVTKGYNFSIVSSAPTIDWDVAHGWAIGAIVEYNGTRYECIGNNIGDAEWIPSASPAQVLSVYDNLVAEGTNSSTTSVMQYGVNVFRTITASDYCTKLPQPVTGKSTIVVNMTNAMLVLYPSNPGGQINNLPIDTPVLVPPDGKSYEFICIENPLPGAWTWTPPATAQYDSGDIISNTSGGFNMIMAANNANQVERTSVYAGTGYAYNGLLTPNIMIDPAPTTPPGLQSVMFKEGTPWLGITKIKWYTNLSATGFTGGLLTSMATAKNLYDPSTGAFVTVDGMSAGTLPASGGNTYAMAGATLGVGDLTANVGDAGTVWGEVFYNSAQIGGISVIGNVYQGQIDNPYNPGQTVDQWISGALGVFFRNNQVLTGFKWRFFVEHY